jgi:hypothetical protein
MAWKLFNIRKPPELKPAPADTDRMPSNAELLCELRRHGAKPPPRAALRTFSRRTRDFLLLAMFGSVAITVVCLGVLSTAETATVLRLAFTGIALLCGLLWFVFEGVMRRY